MADTNITHIKDRQTKYALRMYQCIPVLKDGVQYDNMMSMQVDRPFVYLHAFTVRKTDVRDRYSDLDQGMTNALLYLDSHPVVQTMNVAEISAFHIAANVYYVQDLRPTVDPLSGEAVNKDEYEQYAFVLLCLNF